MLRFVQCVNDVKQIIFGAVEAKVNTWKCWVSGLKEAAATRFGCHDVSVNLARFFLSIPVVIQLKKKLVSGCPNAANRATVTISKSNRTLSGSFILMIYKHTDLHDNVHVGVRVSVCAVGSFASQCKHSTILRVKCMTFVRSL